MKNPPVWTMVRSAADTLEKATYSEIVNYIQDRWEGVKAVTVRAEIIACTVNHISRTHYNWNLKPRDTTDGSPYDIFYRTAPGAVEKYDPARHGVWQIYTDENGRPGIREKKTDAYLFAWNAQNWPFEELEEKIRELHKAGTANILWSVAAFRQAQPGNRAFICKVGSTGPKGIFASGRIMSAPFLSDHWDGSGKQVHRVFIELDMLLNPREEDILKVTELENNVSAEQHWTPQSSGIRIIPACLPKLEQVWFDFLSSRSRFTGSGQEPVITEGASGRVTVTVYERNPYARQKCLEHHGYGCRVCSFNFEQVYGEIGKDFIHVHHLTPLASAGAEHHVDPVNDLVPVCPNCHAMLHRRNPPYTPEELSVLMAG